MQYQISAQLENVGATFIRVVPDFSAARGNPFLPVPELTYDDAVAVRRGATAVRDFTPLFIGSASLKYGDTHHDTSLIGVNQSYPDVAKQFVDHGRFFGTLDEDAKKRVCVLGSEAARQPGQRPIGKDIRMDDSNFTVIGVMEKRGSSATIPTTFTSFATAQCSAA
jgi:putative ABC transport system permease protein